LRSIASWAAETVDVRLDIDWAALDIDAGKATITAPQVEDFQPAATFVVGEAIPVGPARGWLLIIE